MPNFVWPGRETGNQFGVALPGKARHIQSSKFELMFEWCMAAILHTCMHTETGYAQL